MAELPIPREDYFDESKNYCTAIPQYHLSVRVMNAPCNLIIRTGILLHVFVEGMYLTTAIDNDTPRRRRRT